MKAVVKVFGDKMNQMVYDFTSYKFLEQVRRFKKKSFYMTGTHNPSIFCIKPGQKTILISIKQHHQHSSHADLLSLCLMSIYGTNIDNSVLL